MPAPTRRFFGIAGLLVAVLAAWANGVVAALRDREPGHRSGG